MEVSPQYQLWNFNPLNQFGPSSGSGTTNLHDALFGRTNNTPSGPFGVPQPTASLGPLFTTIPDGEPGLLDVVNQWGGTIPIGGYIGTVPPETFAPPGGNVFANAMGEMRGSFGMSPGQLSSYSEFMFNHNNQQMLLTGNAGPTAAVGTNIGSSFAPGVIPPFGSNFQV